MGRLGGTNALNSSISLVFVNFMLITHRHMWSYVSALLSFNI